MSSPITSVGNVAGVHLGANRRSAQRSVAQMQAILRFQDRLFAIQGSVCDVGVGGAGFVCQQAVAAQTKCTLQFELPVLGQGHGPGQSVVVPAVVVSTMQVVGQAYQFRVNLRFVGATVAAQRLIEGFIRQSLSRG